MRKRIEIKRGMNEILKQVGLAITTAIMLLNYSCSNSKSIESTNQWITTYGSVIGISKNRSIQYEIDGKIYKQRFYKSFYGMADVGEKYELKYNPTNPNEIEICYSCPMFLPEETTQRMTGIVTAVKWTGGGKYKYIVQYYFSINGRRIEKSQALPPNYKELYPFLSQGQTYNIDVWVNNAYRAVMYLDQPVNFHFDR